MKHITLTIVSIFLLAGCIAVGTEALKGGKSAYDYQANKDGAYAGDAQSQYKLGQSYCCGFGAGYKNDKAYHWYCKAAKQGHTEALFELGKFFTGGEGFFAPAEKLRRVGSLPKDYRYSLAFFELAKESGSSSADRWINNIKEDLNSVELAQAADIKADINGLSCNLNDIVR